MSEFIYQNLMPKNRIRNRCKNNGVTSLQSTYFYLFWKSNQEKTELGDNEASAEETSRGQQGGNKFYFSVKIIDFGLIF